MNYNICRAVDTIFSQGPRTQVTWKKIESLYNKWVYKDVKKYSIDISPFSVHWVDPDDIKYITGRSHKPWDNKKQLVGTVASGNWDNRRMKNSPSTYTRQFADWVLYKSARDRIKNDVEWEETKVYETYRERGINHKYTIDRLKKFDRVVDNLKNDGYMSQKELYLERRGENSVLDALLNEINVDIGSDGGLFFVDGRHRLIAAKCLEIPRIPVTVLVRHKQWMEKLSDKETVKNSRPI